MREAFAHDATLEIAPGGDDRAPGAAITAALCGHWEHEPPCPLAPHHTRAERDGEEVRLRTLFVVEPELEGSVRKRIGEALASSRLLGPDGVTTTWRLRSCERSEVDESEREDARALLHDQR